MRHHSFPGFPSRSLSIRPVLCVALFCAAPSALALSACGGGASAVRDQAEELTARRLYPMAEGNVWTFDVDDSFGENVFHYLRVEGADGAQRRVTVPSGETHIYELREEGLYLLSNDTWVLREPIEVGTEWPARGGRTARITDLDVSADVPAGRFTGCVEVQESGGETGQRTRTVYCPDVGPVIIETRMPLDLAPQGVAVVAKLRAYQLAE